MHLRQPEVEEKAKITINSCCPKCYNYKNGLSVEEHQQQKKIINGVKSGIECKGQN
jgi:hypothetical protein